MGGIVRDLLLGAFATKNCNKPPVSFTLSVCPSLCPRVTTREQLNGFS
jgi:hypothetical protein